MKPQEILYKCCRKIYSTFFIIFHQKTRFTKYLLKTRKKAKKLIVVFSAFPMRGKSGGYNYVWSMRGINENVLWILDDCGYNKAGSYYLGSYSSTLNDFSWPSQVMSFIKDVKAKTKSEEMFFCGTSKGGTSALYYGLLCKADKVIIGSPQYYLGDYLSENEYHKNILTSICNDVEAVDILNDLLPTLIKKNICKETVETFIMYSDKERSYESHLKPLIDDLKASGVKVTEKMQNYSNHSDIGLFYPEWMLKIIKQEGEDEND